ncbi:MAG: nucleotidyl transferase AbiEii/AbiGii toxin family protein [Acidobacteriota bacterium]
MIPVDYITEWRQHAPWTSDAQVEQDLVLCRAIVDIFGDAKVAAGLAFRGATAIYKLHVRPAARYSEDIDLVQIRQGPIGPIMNAARARLDPWLGEPKWELKR